MRRAPRRLPAITFEAPPPQLDEVLPRMDIAAFVGFAASGPVHVPVPVESERDFEAVFGGDLTLAWDGDRGETVRAQLGPAVRSFFRNGGARCWVIRVADRPSFNFFPVPGLVRWSGAALTPTFARASSPGSWSDGLAVGAAEEAEPLEAIAFGIDERGVWVDLAAADNPRPGDLLRVTGADELVVMVAIDSIDEAIASPPASRPVRRARGSAAWFRQPASSSPPVHPSTAVVYTASRRPSEPTELFERAAPIVDFDERPAAGGAPAVRVCITVPLAEVPPVGALASIDAGPEQLWLSIRDVTIVGRETPETARVELRGTGLWWLRTPPALWAEDGGAAVAQRCERMALDLWARRTHARHERLSGLGLVPGHPRYWAALPDDAARHARGDGTERRQDAMLREARGFPLAGSDARAVYLPIAMPLVPDAFLGAARQPQSALERDGLAAFGPALFLDADLVAPTTERLLGVAEHIRYRKENGRSLTGIHAALEIEEATIVAVPDAAQRGWSLSELQDPPPPEAAAETPAAASAGFHGCDVVSIDPPVWSGRLSGAVRLRADTGTFTLEWNGGAGDTFELQEARLPDFSDATTIYSGSEARLDIYGRSPGAFYYHVRATRRGAASAWSQRVIVAVAGARQWQLIRTADYSPGTLLTVQRALLRLASARGDLFAVLAAPEHLRDDAVLEWVATLKDPAGDAIRVARGPEGLSLPLGTGEARAFSYGALYYPWIALRDRPGDQGLTRSAPDGPAAGLIAGRALRRGAWVAPANEPLRGALATAVPVSREWQARLVEAAVNVIAQSPRGFLPLSASTLSDDPDLAPINVRRLLGLLRRLALREGATYVFEPHDAAFRRLVQRGFERMLTHMFERGAFAGASASSAFQVNTASSLNTPRSVDAGRFIVELRVAPSLPMSFLTVRLVQSGDRALVVEDR